MADYWWTSHKSSDTEFDSYRLFELGATGVLELENSTIKAFFEDPDHIKAALQEFSAHEAFSSGTEKIEDWDQSWRLQQTPVEVTEKLTVIPPWLETPESSFTLKIEAKMAFGTGTHETTRLCALLLETLDLKGKRVLDIGTGTGILALYCAQLGAEQVFSLDIDPATASCFAENVELNKASFDSPPLTFVGGIDSIFEKRCFDLILCNMIRSELWPFRQQLWSRLNPGGNLIVSGQLFESDKSHFIELFQEWGQAPDIEKNLGEWWGFRLQKKKKDET